MSRVQLGKVWVDLNSGLISGGKADGQRLGAAELRCLSYLAERPNQDVSREALRRDVWGQGPQSLSRAPDHTVRRLRRRLEGDPTQPRFLLGVRGVGYRLVSHEAVSSLTSSLPVGRDWLQFGCVRVDLHRQVLVTPEGDEEGLSALESNLLRVLFEAGGQVVSKEELSRRVWGHVASRAQRRRIDTAIWRLRRRLEVEPSHPAFLLTARGQGVRLKLGQVRELNPRLGGVPPRVASFVGRGAELKRLQDLLSHSPLVTLTGPGGVGKTALAVEGGRRWCGREPGRGLLFCDLTGVTSVEALLRSVLDALQISLPLFMERRDRLKAIASTLAATPERLLLLDNFEQLQSKASSIVATWAQSGGRVLVTSRLSLKVALEARLILAPMDYEEAHTLFALRATPGSDIHSAAVSKLVRRLDCLPLAIELAAAQTDTLEPREILSRLDQGPQALQCLGHPLARHRNLVESFRWSWRLLPRSERRALSKLAVFVSEFSLEGVEAIVGLQPSEAAALVRELVGRSMLQVRRHARGATTYHLLMTVRELILEEAPLLQGTFRRYALYIESTTARLNQALERYGRYEEWRQLRLLLPESEHAWQWCLNGDCELAAKLLLASIRAKASHGGALEAVICIETTLERLVEAPSLVRLGLLYHQLRLYPILGRLDECGALIEAATVALPGLETSTLKIKLQLALALVFQMKWELRRCLALTSEAAAMAREIGDASLLSNALSLKAYLCQQVMEDPAEVKRLGLEAEAANRRSENAVARGSCFYNLAFEAMCAGQMRQALRCSQKACEAVKDGWDLNVRSAASALRGSLLWLCGDAEAGRMLLLEGVQAMIHNGLRGEATIWLGYSGMLYLRDGYVAEAEKALVQSLEAAAGAPGFQIGPVAFLGVCDAINGSPVDGRARVQEARALATPEDETYLETFLSCISALIELAVGGDGQIIKRALIQLRHWTWGELGSAREVGIWLRVAMEMLQAAAGRAAAH